MNRCLRSWRHSLVLLSAGCALAQAGDAGASPLGANPLPETGVTLLRLLGALALVLALFLGSVWLFRNWQRVLTRRGQAPKLNVIEVRALGQRHALYVVGYEHERLLLAASPAGVTLLTHLPGGGAVSPGFSPAPSSFAETLQGLQTRKT